MTSMQAQWCSKKLNIKKLKECKQKVLLTFLCFIKDFAFF